MLYLVATPIGNLADITLRALDVLKSADVIAAEDTRHSAILLQRHQISKPLVSFHEHNEARRTAEFIEQLREGKNIAVISDAGMPGINDPGHRIVRACIENNLPYSVIPGASSLLTALVGSGFPADKFFFGGFLPVKSGGREREVLAAGARAETSVFFESPHRLLKTLEVFARHFPERILCVARELTKTFEEFRAAKPAELAAHFTAHPPKGEIVLLVCALTREERRSRAAAEDAGGDF
jgi:16S rRNA (cytidine1402-2'-O)-methyltransferase